VQRTPASCCTYYYPSSRSAVPRIYRTLISMTSHRRKRPNIGSNINGYLNDHTTTNSSNNNNNNNNNGNDQSSFNTAAARTGRLRGRTTAARKKDDAPRYTRYDQHDGDDEDNDSDNDEDDDDVPFCCLTLKVGTVLSCLAVACCTLFGTSKVLKNLYPDFILLHQKSTTVIVAPSPSWIVSTNDAFGIAQKYRLDDVLQKFNINNNSHTRSNNNNNNNNNKNEDYNDFHSFLIESASLRRQFQQRYGRHARSLLGHGLSSILDMDNSDDGGNNNTDDYGRRLLLTTLTQILADKKRRRRKHQQDRREHPEHRDVDRRGDDYEFRILVVGNAAAAGYGNYHSQAYSFLLQRLLQPSFQTLLGLNLVVTNLAMDGVAEFPLSWCLTSKNYYSSQHYSLLPDVIVWDFPRTSSTSVQRLEAFIRHWSLVSTAANDNNTTAAAPLLIFREQWKDEYSSGKKKKTTKNKGVDQGEKEEQEDPQYLTLLKYYRRASVLSDATLLVHEAQATRPFFEQRGGGAAATTALPRGLIDWHKFGGPAGSSSLDHIHAHLTLQQHELVAWLIGMHFLAALELLAAQSLNFINNINNATSATSGRKTKKKKGGSHPTINNDDDEKSIAKTTISAKRRMDG
jgi:hypothetical protein